MNTPPFFGRYGRMTGSREWTQPPPSTKGWNPPTLFTIRWGPRRSPLFTLTPRFLQSPRNPTETTPTYPGWPRLFELTRFGLSISKLLRRNAKVEKVTGAWCPLVGNWDHYMTPGPKLHALLYKGENPFKITICLQCFDPPKTGHFMTPG